MIRDGTFGPISTVKSVFCIANCSWRLESSRIGRIHALRSLGTRFQNIGRSSLPVGPKHMVGRMGILLRTLYMTYDNV